jgi:HSP20 family protein
MNLVKFNSFSPIRRNEYDFGTFANQMDQLFGNTSGLTSERRTPPANISETKEAVLIQLAAPGMKKSDFNIQLDKNLLTISTVNHQSENEEQVNDQNEVEYCYRSEFDYSRFSRSFRLGKMLDHEKIDARYEEGLLTVTIQKKPEAIEKPAREISIL